MFAVHVRARHRVARHVSSDEVLGGRWPHVSSILGKAKQLVRLRGAAGLGRPIGNPSVHVLEQARSSAQCNVEQHSVVCGVNRGKRHDVYWLGEDATQYPLFLPLLHS